MGAAALVLTAFALTPGTALGHQASITHAKVQVAGDRTTVEYRLSFAPKDVGEAIGLGVDVDPTDAQVAAGAERLLTYVFPRLRISDGDTPCAMEIEGQGVDGPLGVHVVQKGGRFVELAMLVRCAQPMTTLVIEYDLFFELDSLHRNILHVRYGDTSAVAELNEDANRFVWPLDQAPPSDILGFILTGIEHIGLGYDHIAFLIGLLLVVTVILTDAAWRLRPLGSALRYTAGIVTSFTAAHSITLIAASMGWISVPSRTVESLIAASIAFVAIENIVKPEARYRFVVTFLFGLVHGLGFASVLRVLLPPDDVIVPLLLFNVGVELGQLAIVVLLLPLLHLGARALGPARYRDWFLPLVSGVLALLGLAWLIERVFGTMIIGW